MVRRLEPDMELLTDLIGDLIWDLVGPRRRRSALFRPQEPRLP
jgi:hypothetical protein